MKDILNKIYNEELLNAVIFTDNYDYLRKIPGVLDIVLTEGFIGQFLAQFSYVYEKNKRYIPTIARKNSLLSVLNDIRFNYHFKNNLEKDFVISKTNHYISFINSVGIGEVKIVYEENSINDKNIPNMFDINFEDLCLAFRFFLVHYYLQKDEKFRNEAIPLFSNNIGYYISSLYDIVNDNPKLLEDREFLLKTKLAIVNIIKYLQLNPQSVYKDEYKIFMKELKRINRVIK